MCLCASSGRKGFVLIPPIAMASWDLRLKEIKPVILVFRILGSFINHTMSLSSQSDSSGQAQRSLFFFFSFIFFLRGRIFYDPQSELSYMDVSHKDDDGDGNREDGVPTCPAPL